MKVKINSLILFGFVCLLTVYSFGNQEDNSHPCPTTLLHAILSHQEEIVAIFLEYGVDPNASLENCQFPIERPSVFDFDKTYYDLTKYSTLLHVAALFTNYHPSIYNLLVKYGADEDALDHRDRKPIDVATSEVVIYTSGQFQFK